MSRNVVSEADLWAKILSAAAPFLTANSAMPSKLLPVKIWQVTLLEAWTVTIKWHLEINRNQRVQKPRDKAKPNQNRKQNAKNKQNEWHTNKLERIWAVTKEIQHRDSEVTKMKTTKAWYSEHKGRKRKNPQLFFLQVIIWNIYFWFNCLQKNLVTNDGQNSQQFCRSHSQTS